MARYHFFLLNPDGIIEDTDPQDCPDDVTAVSKARALQTDSNVDVWQAARHVATVKMASAMLSTQDSPSP